MNILQVNGTLIKKGVRFIKNKFSYDAHESAQVAPFGDDSCPLPNAKGVSAETSTSSIRVVIGYFSRIIKAAPGEKYLYSLKPDGSESISIHLKNNGSFKVTCSDGFTAEYDLTNKRIKFSGDCIAGVDGISLVNHVHDTLVGVTTPPFNPTI